MAMKRMLIDTVQEEETRVVIMNDNMLEVVEYDNERNKQTKGNIYLGRISRIEPSLQAVFVDYGGNRHGFLPFSEVHPDYYLLTEKERERLNELMIQNYSIDLNEEGNVAPKKPLHPSSVYDIYHALKPNQPLMIQVVKEERGNKGAALTTIISISGRYCVFMPNTHNNSGVSRKITSSQDRQRIREILESLELPFGVSTIIRTAGEERSKQEIVRDMKYLIKLWETICIDAKKTKQVGLIYEEANLIRRAIRDIYTRDIDEILVEGEKGFEQARNFMKVITPSHSKKILEYKDESLPLFHRYKVEFHLNEISNPTVVLPSGGSIVISPTEALVAVDVNSGKSTRANSVEETAFQTNLEATVEIMRQLQLKNLAGLIVIDFIDMLNPNNQKLIEQEVKKLAKEDNAKIQMSKISRFGLLELSRQRLRPSIFETHSISCPHCSGTGYMRSDSSSALHIIRAIEEEAIRGTSPRNFIVLASKDAVLYILNEKSAYIGELETKFNLKIAFDIDATKKPGEYAFVHLDDNNMEIDTQSNHDYDNHTHTHNGHTHTTSHSTHTNTHTHNHTNNYHSNQSHSHSSGHGENHHVNSFKKKNYKYNTDTQASYTYESTSLRKGRKSTSYNSNGSESTYNKFDSNHHMKKERLPFVKKRTLSPSEKRAMDEIIKSAPPMTNEEKKKSFTKKTNISPSEKRAMEEIIKSVEDAADSVNTTFAKPVTHTNESMMNTFNKSAIISNESMANTYTKPEEDASENTTSTFTKKEGLSVSERLVLKEIADSVHEEDKPVNNTFVQKSFGNSDHTSEDHASDDQDNSSDDMPSSSDDSLHGESVSTTISTRPMKIKSANPDLESNASTEEDTTTPPPRPTKISPPSNTPSINDEDTLANFDEGNESADEQKIPPRPKKIQSIPITSVDTTTSSSESQAQANTESPAE